LASPAKLFIHRRIPKGEAPASRPIQSTHATHDVAKQAIRGVWVSFAGRCRSNCGVIDRSIGRSRAWTAIDRARKHTVHGVLSQHQLFSLATGMVPFFFFPFLALFFLKRFWLYEYIKHLNGCMVTTSYQYSTRRTAACVRASNVKYVFPRNSIPHVLHTTAPSIAAPADPSQRPQLITLQQYTRLNG